MAIDYEREEYEQAAPIWERINRCVDNDAKVREYIHTLNENDKSTENEKRNKLFKERAVFSAVASYTARGFLGLIFEQPVKIELPPLLDYLETNVDGTGIGLVQQAQAVTKSCIAVGRYGLWVDYPDTGGRQTTMAELRNRAVFATIQVIKAEDVFYWNTKQIGSEVILKEVRFHSTELIEEDYELVKKKIIVQLYLNDSNQYMIQKWEYDEKFDEWKMYGPAKMPLGGGGQPLNRIPFVFGGSESNNWRIDPAPMRDIAEMNIAHLNNSAIYEDSVLKVSQPQPWMSGVPFDQIDEMDDDNWYIGSGRIINVPTGSVFGFAEVSENGMGRQAMQDKLQIMIGLGAMFVQPGEVAKTATQTQGEQRTKHSVLSLIAINVTETYNMALKFVAEFMGTELPEDEEIFKINDDFVQPDADANMLREMVAAFMAGAIPPADYQQFLKDNRMTDDDKELEEFMAELSAPGQLDLEDERIDE